MNSPISQSIRIVLIEDHAILRAGIRALLDLQPDLEVVADAASGAEGVRLAREAKPTLAIVDLRLPGESGLHTVAELRMMCAPVGVLVLTAHCSDDYIRAALSAGAGGYVLKSASAAELLRAIHLVAAGDKYFSSEVSARLVSGYLGHATRPTDADVRITQRERELLARIALGASNKRLADTLCLSIKTIEKHRANLMRKLGLHNIAELTLFAVRSGIVRLPQGEALRDDGSAPSPPVDLSSPRGALSGPDRPASHSAR